MRTCFHLYRPLVALLAALLPLDVAIPDEVTGILTLRDRQTIEGRIGTTDALENLRWRAKGFSEPFAFEFDVLKKLEIDRGGDAGNPTGTFAFELSSGDLVTGDLMSSDGVTLTIASDVAGELTIPMSGVQRVYRVVDNPTLVFAHLAGLQDWSSNHWNNEGWGEDGTELRSEQPDATLIGDLEVPRQAIIEFEIAWSGTPNFHLALGCDPDKHPDESSGWAVTCIGKTLAIFRERQRTADLDILSMLEDDSSVRLTAYLDQDKDEITVYEADGTLAGQLKAADEGDAGSGDAQQTRGNHRGTGVMLTNRDGQTTLRRLRVAKWIGKQMQNQGDATARLSVVTSDAEVFTGESFRMDQDNQTLTVIAGDGEESIKLSDLAGIDFRVEPASSESSEDADDDRDEEGDGEADRFDPRQTATVLLRDGARLSGQLKSVSEKEISLVHGVTGKTVAIGMDYVRSVSWRKATWTSPDTSTMTLRLPAGSMKGRLVTPEGPLKAEDGNGAGLGKLAWQPAGSALSARFESGLNATITGFQPFDSEKPVKNAKKSPVRPELDKIRARIAELRRRADNNQAAQSDSPEHESPDSEMPDEGENEVAKTFDSNLFLISGDHFACRLIGSGVEGVTVDAREGGQTLVPHDQIKAIEMIGDAAPPRLEDAKRRRLLTLPRLQKDSPPTHLLVAGNGDMLRCRIQDIDEEAIRAEIRLDEMKLPRERITQIIWLHPESLTKAAETEDGKEAPAQPTPSDERFADYLQAVMRDGENRVTFLPTGMDAKGAITGKHDVFGDCRVDLSNVQTLVLGTAIGSIRRDDSYQGWTLRAAKEPLVAAAMRGEMPIPSHELNGKRAPEVNLPLLDGDRFRLSNHRGQVVVLDFWASWCAPCMQTMPKVDDLIAGYDPTQVKLVTVNLSDAEDKIRLSLKRLNIRPEVALDIDGIAADRYSVEAIPMLVVINQEGVIQTVFVGGGDVMIKQLSTTIDGLLQTAQ